MRAAASEELEAQKIYAEAAMLKADAHQALDQLKAQSPVSERPRAVGSDEQGVSWGMGNGPRQISQAENSKAHEAPAQVTEVAAGTDHIANETARSVAESSNHESGEPELTPVLQENEGEDSNKNDGSQRARAKDRRVRAA